MWFGKYSFKQGTGNQCSIIIGTKKRESGIENFPMKMQVLHPAVLCQQLGTHLLAQNVTVCTGM